VRINCAGYNDGDYVQRVLSEAAEWAKKAQDKEVEILQMVDRVIDKA
jgi:hypothetical protein